MRIVTFPPTINSKRTVPHILLLKKLRLLPMQIFMVWIKDASKFHHALKKCRRVGSDTPTAYPAAKEALVKWILEFRQNGLTVTMNMIKDHENLIGKRLC
ncbi:1333_t:CDS:2 [Ambispora gerdemannii]|uniref:1333_t:CDS:1 n=1 Tax=Ambispora gerdemannii TaxID=144530 RepID=A0A9N9GCY1_9GLOM|nr:1333_t:CDS:2 [Ambispora gerdemannii]